MTYLSPMKHITNHFKWSEALTTDTNLVNEPGPYERANLVQTFRILERVRVFCDFPLKINSAFRSPAVNDAVGGNKNSYHLEGRAVDISTKLLSERQICKLFNNLLTYAPLEIYEDTKKHFIHVAF